MTAENDDLPELELGNHELPRMSGRELEEFYGVSKPTRISWRKRGAPLGKPQEMPAWARREIAEGFRMKRVNLKRLDDLAFDFERRNGRAVEAPDPVEVPELSMGSGTLVELLEDQRRMVALAKARYERELSTHGEVDPRTRSAWMDEVDHLMKIEKQVAAQEKSEGFSVEEVKSLFRKLVGQLDAGLQGLDRELAGRKLSADEVRDCRLAATRAALEGFSVA